MGGDHQMRGLPLAPHPANAQETCTCSKNKNLVASIFQTEPFVHSSCGEHSMTRHPVASAWAQPRFAILPDTRNHSLQSDNVASSPRLKRFSATAISQPELHACNLNLYAYYASKGVFWMVRVERHQFEGPRFYHIARKAPLNN